MSKKILYIIDSLDHGGTEKQLVQLISHLNRDLFEPHLCTLKQSIGLYNQLSIGKVFLDFKSFASLSIFSSMKKLIEYIRNNRIDIIQTFFQDPFLIAALSRPFHSAYLVGSFRDLGFWRTRSESLKMRLGVPAFSGFIANSQAVKDHFSRVDRIRSEKISVVYNGFDIEQIQSLSEKNIDNTPRQVGIVANLNRPVKRVQDFIEAAALIHKKAPDVCFIIIGDGHLRPGLEAQAKSLRIQHRVTFLGSQANPLEFINNFAVGVITSETEGFSNAIIEYMACGIPVVATATGGNPEVVKDGENGFLVPVGSIELLAERILQLLQEPFHSQVGLRNKTKIFEEYSLPAMVVRYQNYYSKLLGLHGIC